MKTKTVKRKRIYVRQRMDSWSSIRIPHLHGDAPLSGDSVGSCGLLIAFPTKKAFLAQHPKEKPFVMELV